MNTTNATPSGLTYASGRRGDVRNGRYVAVNGRIAQVRRPALHGPALPAEGWHLAVVFIDNGSWEYVPSQSVTLTRRPVNAPQDVEVQSVRFRA